MKIYQLHEYYGEWEDRGDYICGSYLRRERAEEEKTKAEELEKYLIERSNRCYNCPFMDDDLFLSVKDIIAKHPVYCNDAKLNNTDYGISCENYYMKHDSSFFKIEEVEVEE
jgi:hypothetical protein